MDVCWHLEQDAAAGIQGFEQLSQDERDGRRRIVLEHEEAQNKIDTGQRIELLQLCQLDEIDVLDLPICRVAACVCDMSLRDINSRYGRETLCQGKCQAAYAATVVDRAADAGYVDLVSGKARKCVDYGVLAAGVERV